MTSRHVIGVRSVISLVTSYSSCSLLLFKLVFCSQMVSWCFLIDYLSLLIDTYSAECPLLELKVNYLLQWAVFSSSAYSWLEMGGHMGVGGCGVGLIGRQDRNTASDWLTEDSTNNSNSFQHSKRINYPSRHSVQDAPEPSSTAQRLASVSHMQRSKDI